MSKFRRTGRITKDEEERYNPHFEDAQGTRVFKLDQVWKSQCDLLKINVEGWDYRVLEGSHHLFDRNPEMIVVMEHHAPLIGDDADELLFKLTEDYNVQIIKENGDVDPFDFKYVKNKTDRGIDLVVRKK